MIVYVMTGLMLFSKNGPIASAVFFLVCLPLYFLYGRFEKKQYERHFSKFIQTHFSDRIGKPASIELQSESFRVIDDEDNTYTYSDIEDVNETTGMIIIQLKRGPAIILPKDKIDNSASLIQSLKESATQKNIPFQTDMNWKWR